MPARTSRSPEGEARRTNIDMHYGAESELFVFARILRRKQTRAEEILWEKIKARKLSGYKFRRQHPIEKYIADFYCHELRYVIEIDGEYHEGEEQSNFDFNRDGEMEKLGIIVKRVSNKDILNNPISTINNIKEDLNNIQMRGVSSFRRAREVGKQ